MKRDKIDAKKIKCINRKNEGEKKEKTHKNKIKEKPIKAKHKTLKTNSNTTKYYIGYCTAATYSQYVIDV